MKITKIVPDFEEALGIGLEVAAERITEQLKIEGPYYTGFFESLWQVNAGNYAVKPNIFDASTKKKKQNTRTYTSVEIPDSPKLMGYTIGNRANYRLFAMDIKPTPSARGAYPAAELTAQKNWYDLYINAKMPETINRALWRALRRLDK